MPISHSSKRGVSPVCHPARPAATLLQTVLVVRRWFEHRSLLAHATGAAVTSGDRSALGGRAANPGERDGGNAALYEPADPAGHHAVAT